VKLLTKFSPYLPQLMEVVDREPLNSRAARIILKLDGGGSLKHEPGQFLMASVMAVGEAPFAIASTPGETWEIIVESSGPVGEALQTYGPGAKLGCRGPYGNPFPVDAFSGQDVLLLSYGLGYAALRGLLLHLLARRSEIGKLVLLAGFKSREDIIFSHELEANRNDLEVQLILDEERPGLGKHCGLVAHAVSRLSLDPDKTLAAVAAPAEMLGQAARALRSAGLPDHRTYVSLESRLRCGLGKCGHCRIDDLNACTDGPVFRLDRLSASGEAAKALGIREGS